MPRRPGIELAKEISNIFFIVLGISISGFVVWHASEGRPVLPSDAFAFLREKNSAPILLDASEPSFEHPTPEFIDHPVPFSPQAPLGDWSPPFGDTAEEAAVVMALSWAKFGELSPEAAHEEILGIIAFEKSTFGYYGETGIAQTAKIITRHYEYNHVRVEFDVTPEDMKRELANGGILIVPLSGTILDNPYYQTPPPYHMVIVRGYDEAAKEFITNDPGTRRGEAWRYVFDRLFEANHDRVEISETPASGLKGMIVISRPL